MALNILICDTETTSLDYNIGHVIEVALLDVKSGEYKNWYLKPLNEKGIEPGALKVNGANLDDLLWKTQAGRDKYKDPVETLPEIENWINDVVGGSVYDRVLCGHNIQFDYNHLTSLWDRCDATDTFPFAKWGQLIDTKQMVLMYDYLKGIKSQKYNLAACIKKFGINKKFEYHGAMQDVLATKCLFDELVKSFTV